MRASRTGAAGEAGDRTGRRLHLARGHFKDFRNGPGLFGKYKGIYWWDQQMRGSGDLGEVKKGYNVHAE